MRGVLRVLIVTAALTMSLGRICLPYTPETPAPKTIPELKAALGSTLQKYHIPGVGIALVSTDKVIWAGGVGKADLAAHRDATADTMFRIGSITKGFVALSILKLQEQGKISLNAKVSDLAPEIPIVNPWDQTDPVPIVNMLSTQRALTTSHLPNCTISMRPLKNPFAGHSSIFPARSMSDGVRERDGLIPILATAWQGTSSSK